MKLLLQLSLLTSVAFPTASFAQPAIINDTKPFEVVVTPYKTTLVADGKDKALVKIHIINRKGEKLPNPGSLLKITISGEGYISKINNKAVIKIPNGEYYDQLKKSECEVIIIAGTKPGYIKFNVTSDSLWAGGTDIITVSPGSVGAVSKLTHLKNDNTNTSEVRMLGADISFLPELEAKGMKFYDNGEEKDAILILKDHGFNYIRLRIFNNPAADSGYSPKLGFCDLQHTMQMAKRVKQAGMKLLLDFHYSDTWADPGKQFKPSAWKGLSFPDMKKALYDYTKDVIQQLKDQGTLPDMVQAGNEINHGMVWPEGNVMHLDSLAQLITAGTEAVKDVAPQTIMLLHLALGGQNEESVFFIDNMLKRHVPFDIIGLSYYPKWHGTLPDLKANMLDLVKRYNKDLIVVEYSQHKPEVNKLAFELPGCRGTCIWEPLNFWEKVFDEQGHSNEWMKVYDTISKKYLK
jgi:beta-galactosidase